MAKKIFRKGLNTISYFVLMAFFFGSQLLFSQEYHYFDSVLQSNTTLDRKVSVLDSLLDRNQFKKTDSLPYILNNYAYFLFDEGEQNRAIHLNLEAIAPAKLNFPEDKSLLQFIYYDLAFYHRQQKQVSKSIDFYKKAITVDPKSNTANVSYYDLGLAFTALGDYYNAIENYKTTVLRLQKAGNNKVILRSAYQNLSYLQFQIQTKESFKKGAEFGLAADSVAALVRTSDAKKYEIKFNLARLHGERQYLDTVKARAYYAEALTFADELQDSTKKAKVFQGLGDLYNIIDAEKSITYFNKALGLANTNDSVLRSDLYNGLGLTYQIVGDFENSLKFRHRAFELLTGNDFKNSKSTAIDSLIQTFERKEELFHFLPQLATTYLEFYKADPGGNKAFLSKALQYYEMADQLLDRLRMTSTSFKSRLFWRRISANLYSNAIETCYLAREMEQGFYYMERNKAILLLEDLYSENLNSGSSDAVSAFQFKLSPDVLTIDKVQSQLLENQIVIIYAITANDDFTIEHDDTSGYVMALTSKSVSFDQIAGLDELKKDCFQLFAQLGHPFKNLEEKNDYARLSNKIYNTLFHSSGLLTDVFGKQLLIIPDNYLSVLPFEALSISADSPTYLLEECGIQYAHSNSFLYQSSNSKKGDKIFGMAPINFGQNDLNNLPDSENELRSLENFYGGELLLRNKATKEAFRKIGIGSSILHLATHANAVGNEEPWIAFDDGQMTLEEVYASGVSADMVVLSGCKTGIGENQPGEGIMNLARGFFYTGSKSVISSLWNINDGATFSIISDFYQNLSEGKSKSESLRLSKLSYLKNAEGSSSSPYYWASLALWGDNSPIKPTYHYSWIYYILALGVVLFFAFLYYNKRLRTFPTSS